MFTDVFAHLLFIITKISVWEGLCSNGCSSVVLNALLQMKAWATRSVMMLIRRDAILNNTCIHLL